MKTASLNDLRDWSKVGGVYLYWWLMSQETLSERIMEIRIIDVEDVICRRFH